MPLGLLQDGVRRASGRSIGAVLALILVCGAAVGQDEPAGGAGQASAEFVRFQRPSPRHIARQFAVIQRSATDVVTVSRAELFARSDSSEVIGALQRGDFVHRAGAKGSWAIVRTLDRRLGYVHAGALSGVWILVSKSKQKVWVLRESDIIATFDADMSEVPEGDKERRGSTANPDQRRTPEGLFYISRLHPHSQFYKALIINYPSPRHAEQGLRLGLINRAQYADIVDAAMFVRNPPMNTPLGGLIEFHGSGIAGKANWTHGCIALSDSDMDRLWALVGVGTPVLIEP